MATDLATLAIKVENGDVIKTTTALNSMEVAGAKAEASTSRLTRRMALLEIEARRMDAEMAKSATTIGKLKGVIESAETAVPGLTAALGALSAIAALGFIGKKTLEETEQAQAAMAQLEAAVKSTGGAAGRTVAQLDALSVSLQKTTTFSDEAVKGAEAMLLTFDKIRGTEFDRATAAVTDLAARMGGDLETAALQLGKALQDPTNGLAALRRSGVSFTAAQIEVVKQLYETGRVAEGQRVILAELEKQFGGSAAAARDTLGGALAALKNAWGDLFEVTKEASQGTVTGINAITHALESSGLSMNKILKDATVDFETMKASVMSVWAVLSTPIGPGWLEKVNNQLDRIDFDLSTKIAELNKPAAIGPSVKPPPRTKFEDDDALKQRNKDLAELQKQTDDYYNSLNQHQIDAIRAAGNSRVQNDQLRALIAAYGESEDAVERVTIAQAGDNAVRELAVGVSQKVADAVRREAEEHERLSIALGKVKDAQAEQARQAQQAADDAAREAERRARDIRRATVASIEGILADVANGRNPLIALAEGFKRAMIHAISEALAEKFLASKFAAMLGIGVEGAAKKQDVAAALMVEASNRQLQAAILMSGRGVPGESTGAHGGVADASVVLGESTSKLAQTVATIGKYLAVAVGGYAAGRSTAEALYSQSHGAFGNYARGAIGGTVSGAITGATIGSAFGPVGAAAGAVVGGVTGLIGGILGIGSASKEAAKQTAELRKALALSMDGLRAEVGKDALAANIAQVNAQRETLRKQIEDAYSGGGRNSDTVRERLRQLAELNALEDERIRQLKEEAATIVQRQQEDYRVRQLRAEGRTKEADALAFQEQQQREREDLVRSFGDAIDATEAQTLAALDAAQAAEKQAFETGKNTDALTSMTRVLNQPTGFKVEPYTYRFGEAQPRNRFAPQIPTPPSLPLSGGTTLSRSAPSVTIHSLTLPNVANVQQFVKELDRIAFAYGGSGMSRADALEVVPTS